MTADENDGKFYYAAGLLNIPVAPPEYPFGGDLWAVFYREKDDAPNYVRVDYRFRYNVGRNSKPEDDKKKFMKAAGTLHEGDTPERMARDFFEESAKKQEELWGEREEPSVVIINGDSTKFIETLKQQPWAHMTTVPAPKQSNERKSK